MSSDTKEAVSLKTTSLDARKANTKTLESEKIIVDGSDLKELIDDNTFKRTDLVNRFEIKDGDYYVLWDDNGLPVEWKLANGYIPPLEKNNAIKHWDIRIFSTFMGK